MGYDEADPNRDRVIEELEQQQQESEEGDYVEQDQEKTLSSLSELEITSEMDYFDVVKASKQKE